MLLQTLSLIDGMTLLGLGSLVASLLFSVGRLCLGLTRKVGS